jgi:CRP-like cAMP-binding protein
MENSIIIDDLLREHATPVELNRGDQLCSFNGLEKHLWYVQEGGLRAYVIIEGEEQDIRFGYTGTFITSIVSFLRQEPSDICIEAIRKSKLIGIPRTKIIAELDTNIAFQHWWRNTLEQLIVQQFEREQDLLFPNPADRYKRVLKRSPQVFQHIPLKYIASYLRMSPETLSRLRNS